MGEIDDAIQRGDVKSIIRSGIGAMRAEAVHDGEATVREIAVRCAVPEMIVRIRVAIAIAVGEVDGDVEEARETITRQLLTLEQWFEDGRACRFGAGAVA